MHALDNPVWTALTGKQSALALSNAMARRFPPEMTLLGAVPANTPMALDSLARLIGKEAVTLYFTTTPGLPAGWEVVRAVELQQMVQDEPTALLPGNNVVELTPADVPEMSVVYAATRPGRTLCPRIQKIGTFLGIRREERLVAMGGLRLHIAGYREITTVATLPEFEGHGYASAIVSALIERIRAKGERPFLTVGKENARAMAIYHRLGFRERALIYSQTIRNQS